MKLVVLTLCLLTLLEIYLVSAIQCLNFNSHMGATFDLGELQRLPGQPSYQIEDGDIPCTPGVESNYTYDFNVCGVVPGAVEQRCRLTLDKKLGTASAIQINKQGTIEEDDDWCYAVGYYNEDQTNVRLLDERDPSKGIKVSYKGDYCTGGKQRMFNIELSCVDKLNPIPTHAYELTGCEYTVYMPSVYGCPLECPVANRALCGGEGHCAYDSDARSAHCYCNHGFGGADCTDVLAVGEEEPLNYSPALLGLIIALFIIIGLLVCGVFVMIKQVAAYRDDIANYQVLKGGDEPESPGMQAGARGQPGWLDNVTNVIESVVSPLASKMNQGMAATRGNGVGARTSNLATMNTLSSEGSRSEEANRNTFTPPGENSQSVSL